MDVAGSDSAEAPRNAGHGLALEDGHSVVLFGMLPAQVAHELVVGEHGSLAFVGRDLRHLHARNRVLADHLVLPEEREDEVHDAAQVHERLAALAVILARVQHLANVRTAHVGHRELSNVRRDVLAKADRVVHHVAHLANAFLEDSLCSFSDCLGTLRHFGELLERCLIGLALFDKPHEFATRHGFVVGAEIEPLAYAHRFDCHSQARVP